MHARIASFRRATEASTVVLARVLADNGDLHTPTGHISIGWLVMEDLFTVFVLVLLPAIFGAGAQGGSGIAAAVGWASIKILALVKVLARTAYLRETEQLRTAGAEAVFSGEGEVALAMAESVLSGLGATPEQIERERQRVHETLFIARPASLNHGSTPVG